MIDLVICTADCAIAETVATTSTVRTRRRSSHGVRAARHCSWSSLLQRGLTDGSLAGNSPKATAIRWFWVCSCLARSTVERERNAISPGAQRACRGTSVGALSDGPVIDINLAAVGADVFLPLSGLPVPALV